MHTDAIFIENKSKIHAMKTKSTMNNDRGFTLVELMIVVALTGIAVIAIYRGYIAFTQSADAQEQIIEMQQNLRIGMYWLEKDIRRAGMHEENEDTAGFVLDTRGNGPGPSSLSFTMDLGGIVFGVENELTADGFAPGDGDVLDDDERLTYKLVAAPLPSPVPDPPWTNFFNLVRTDENNGGDPTAAPPEPDDPIDNTIITNVDALNFVYLNEIGEDLDEDETPDDPADGRVFLNDINDRNSIRSIQVAIVVRTTNEDFRYTNNEEYRNLQGDLIYKAPGDNFRRRLLVKEIKIRNAGL